jgi:hypothetical protein
MSHHLPNTCQRHCCPVEVIKILQIAKEKLQEETSNVNCNIKLPFSANNTNNTLHIFVQVVIIFFYNMVTYLL